MARPGLRRVAWLAGVGALLLAGVTGLALEGQETAELRTRRPDGGVRVTRVWVADADGALWVEAANPERAWYRDLLHEPRAEIVRGDGAHRVVAEPLPGPRGHARIRALLRARYGWADRWVGLLQDTSRSVAVRLDRTVEAGP